MFECCILNAEILLKKTKQNALLTPSNDLAREVTQNLKIDCSQNSKKSIKSLVSKSGKTVDNKRISSRLPMPSKDLKKNPQLGALLSVIYLIFFLHFFRFTHLKKKNTCTIFYFFFFFLYLRQFLIVQLSEPK